jgi:hypothetical protein
MRMIRLQWLTLALLAVMAALICLLPAPVPASAGTRPAAGPEPPRLEWQVRDASAPYPAIVLPSASAPWFGYAGAPLYLSWQPGDAAALLYLPPAGCPDPQRACESTCPPTGPGCYTAWVSYRRVSLDPAQDQTILLLPNNLPFAEGWPGDPVALVPDPTRDGVLRWELP